MNEHYLDYKATVWFRIPIKSKEYLEKVKNMIESGDSPSDLYNDLDIEHEIGECEVLFETEEFINPEENQNQSTIEIYEDGKLIWRNSII
jgi:hypothetical protein